MKKYLPYILIGLIILAVAFLFLWGKKEQREYLDERISFRKRDKIPYGMYAAYENLQAVFPKANVMSNRREPGYWDSLSEYGKNQALIIVVPEFNPDEWEMKNLIRFAESGNSVFISTMDINREAAKILKCNIRATEEMFYYYSGLEVPDTLTVFLNNPPFKERLPYTYPGKRFDSYFSNIDTSIATVLGYDEKGRPDFIHFKAGSGNLLVHLAPMTFSNYFLLHKNNFAYYENLLSVIPAATVKVAWDEYYLAKKGTATKKPSNWLSIFIKYPGLKWALIIALLTLLVYILMEMRRKQRPIPEIAKPKNDSLDFVKTIGRLYHDKGDHKNLSKKMAAYFLEHVRTRYKMPTNQLNDEFIKQLTFKTGVEETEISSIVYFIRALDELYEVNNKQLVAFHKQLEKFYSKA